ncbi:glutathione S-transferase [Hypoxylon sp. FL1284]|nr:glutathione S-transferase [Hypoxylon sp. FL1284]
MAPFAKIITYPNNFRVRRAQVVAAINGLEITTTEDEFQMRVTNQTPEFLAKFPLGKVPAMECADGFCVSEGGAMCTYLARSGPKAGQLLGADAKTEALISQWSYFAETELTPSIQPLIIMLVLKLMPVDEKLYEKSIDSLERALKAIDASLQGGKKFLVGDTVTMADIMVSAILYQSAGFLIDAEMRKSVPNVTAWLQGLAALPEFKPFGELKDCETRIKP